MPIYEFDCDGCGERFEALVDLGTEATECRSCGSGRTTRVLSAQAPALHLVKSRGDARKQEAKNAQLHRKTKERYKAARARQRARQGQGQKGQ